jgi:DNA polymerase
MSAPICIDYETFYSSKLKYTLKTSIAEQYCRHELFDPYIIAATDGASCWAGSIKDFNWEALDGQIVIAHNSYFEQTVTKELERRKWIPEIYKRVKAFHCTANMGAYLTNMRALDQVVEKLLGIKISKDERAAANNKKWPHDFPPEQQKRMLDYAKGDVAYGHALWTKFSHLWPEHEQRLSQLSIEAGMYGIRVDRNLLDRFILQTHEMLMNIEGTIPWIKDSEDDWEDFNTKPTSTKCIAEQCRRDGIPCAPVKSDDEEAYEEWENLYAPTHKWIYMLGSWRTVNKEYKKLLVIKQRMRDDETVPFELKYFGAHTGRWSGGSKLNLLNLAKRPMLCNEVGLLEVNQDRLDEAFKQKDKHGVLPEWVKYSIDTRNLFIPRPGMKMITADLEQIEPRILAWLSGNTSMLESMAKGDSPYVAHARATMGFTGADMKKEEPGRYALAKARVLALGYQAGWEKFILMAKTLCGLDITKDDPEFVEQMDSLTGEVKKVSGYGLTSKQIVKEFREQNPKIVALWNRLDDAFKRSIGSDFIMNLPSGRKMRYEKVRCETRIEPDAETKKPRRKTVFTALNGSKRVITYGGKLTENITQAVARDAFIECLLALEKESLRVLFHVYDEAVLEVPQEITAEQVGAIMGRPITWLPGCTVAADAKEVPCYTK